MGTEKRELVHISNPDLNRYATRSLIKTIVIASDFSMHKRLVATDFDCRLVAMVRPEFFY